ncbi:M20/M25/M40 family metallo-hydrolase [Aquipuribacter sp. MA13-6]|uniref:M20/M25/M40 family metallo-hydrolase n=1 Tax=unclassified Aquipuribacter TaxID=2635084 RepID=UPI003EE97C3B
MHRSTRPWRLGAVAVTAGSLVAASVVALPAAAAPAGRACDNRANLTYSNLLDCITLDGVMEHLEAFQAIADDNGGDRADQTPGFDASVDYVVDELESYGWQTELVPFTYPGVESQLHQLSPVSATYDQFAATGTGEGDVTAAVVPVDVNLTPPRANSSGCEASDFAGFPAGAIALLQRGTCPFSVKALNAEAAGASAVVLFNQGDTDAEDRNNVLNATLGGADVVDIPVVGTSFAAGQALAAPGSTARVQVDLFDVESVNVIAELAGRTDDNVVIAGSHLDSAPGAPGISDTATGVAALLEVGQMMARSKPQNTVRLAFWGAEELGLFGSTEWVGQRTQAELDEIALYLNFDMIGSPNHYLGVYDADESSFPAPAGIPIPDGSQAIEKAFESFFTLSGEPYDDSEFSGRSDYQAFILNDIPSGGLFTGADGVKTPEQAAIWGGTAGALFDPCYHTPCDDISNLNLDALEINADAVAFAVFRYAHSTEEVNGVEGRRVPGRFLIPAPAGPEGTFLTP